MSKRARIDIAKIDTEALQAHIQTLRLPRACREVAIALAGHVNSDGVSAPSVVKLAKESGYSDGSVRHALRRLVASGVLTRRIRRSAEHGGHMPSEYTFHLDGTANAPNEP